MRKRILIILSCMLISACSLFSDREPHFAPGEYGGDPLPGTEFLYNVRISPDGSKIALIRQRTPNEPLDPRNQLWLTNRDGSNPQLLGRDVRTIDWSPDGTKLAISVAIGIIGYAYTIDLTSGESRRWTGDERHFFSKPTAGLPIWFQDGRRLLISVHAKAYQQPFERGIYILDTVTEEVEGPLAELMQAGQLGNRDSYVIGRKYTFDRHRLDGNAARYDFTTGTWNWITSFPYDSLKLEEVPVPNPADEQIVQSRFVDYAWQLFLLDRNNHAIQITELGGQNPRWTYDGQQIIFQRDVHKGPGGQFVQYIYDVATAVEEPLWPELPDLVPDFPPVSIPAGTTVGILDTLDDKPPVTRDAADGGDSDT